MEFKLDGQKIKPTFGYDPVKIKKYLDKLPDGEMLTVGTLAGRLNVAAGHLRDNITKKIPTNFMIVSHKTFFGSEKTIKAYKSQYEKSN